MTFSVTDMSHSDNDTTHGNGESVFMRLMSTARKANERKLPEFLGDGSGNSKNKLYNSVINWLKKNNLTFSAGCVDTLGKELVTTLTNTFWYIDGYFKTLSDRGHGVPEIFHPFQNFNRPEKHKHRKREGSDLKHKILSDHSSVLFKIAGSSYMKGCKTSLNPGSL